jgi:hypothetical protein
MTRRLLIVALCAALAATLLPVAASAQEDDPPVTIGDISEDDVSVGGQVPGGPGAGGGDGPDLIYEIDPIVIPLPILLWLWIPVQIDIPCWRGPDGLVVEPPAPPPPVVTETGTMVILTPINPATGAVAGEPFIDCSLANPQPPPPPPTPQEVWAMTPLPDPTVHVNPDTPGLVGLEAWYWADPAAGPISATVNIRGYVVTVTATAVGWWWDPGDGSARLYSSRPGTRSDPAAEHAYTRQGGYDITAGVRWQGTFTMSFAGTVIDSSPLGTATATATEPYEVDEIEAVIVG